MNFGIAVHGGAQHKDKSELSPDQEAAYRSGVGAAVDHGWDVLERGDSALGAVQEAVRVLEDNMLFNAGRGAVKTRDGGVELDAAIMCGRTMRAGAVACVRNIRNPVDLARAVMEQSPHVFLCGEGAEEFGRASGVASVNPSYFFSGSISASIPERGTVGAVALDREGNLAAATSTGGLGGKMRGRVGDSPVIGAGTFARNDACAVSCTGEGELIMRGVVAHTICALMRYKSCTLREACAIALAENDASLRAEMGIIAIDRAGNIEMVCNTLPMYRASRSSGTPGRIAVWED